MDIKQIIAKGLIPSATRNERASEQVQKHSNSFSNLFNEYARKTKSITNDKSRNHSEKCALYDRVTKKMEKELGDVLANMADSVANHAELYQQTKATYLKGGDKYVNLHLATHLRDNADKATELMNSDLRYVQASADFPSSYFGMNTDKLNELQDGALHKHVPELQGMRETLQHSEQHTQRMVKYYDALKAELNVLTDPQALESRVNADEI